MKGARTAQEIKTGSWIIILRRINRLFVAFLSCLALFGTATAFSAESAIVHPSVSQSINEKQLRSIFSMRRREWQDGTAITVFVLPDSHQTHKSFCKNSLSMFPHRLRKAWNRLVFTGTGQAPEEVKSEEEMLQKVRQTPGAIGYLSVDKIDATVKSLSDQKENSDENK